MSNERKVVIAELVCRAIADLHEPDGSTETQIREYIENEYKIPDVAIRSYITTALQTGAAFGFINKKRRNKFQLSKLVDNIQAIAKVRNKPRKRSAKLPVRRVRTQAINKPKRGAGQPKKMYPPQQSNKFDDDQIFLENQNYDDEFDDNFEDDDNNEQETSESEGSQGKQGDEIDDKHSKSAKPIVKDSASADEQQDYGNDENDIEYDDYDDDGE